MSARAQRGFRPLALGLALALTVAPLAISGAALADEPSSPQGSGSGSGSTVSQVNKAFTMLFMVMKLVDILSHVDLPAGGGAPPPIWGSHPQPLPVMAPVVPADGADAPYVRQSAG